MSADERGCFYLCTLAFEEVPARLPYFNNADAKFEIELGYDRLFPLLREAFCSPDRYVMQDALLPTLSSNNPLNLCRAPKLYNKYNVGLVRLGLPGVPPERKVVLAKEDLRELCIVYHPEDGRAFVHSTANRLPGMTTGMPGAKRAKTK